MIGPAVVTIAGGPKRKARKVRRTSGRGTISSAKSNLTTEMEWNSNLRDYFRKALGVQRHAAAVR